MLTIMSDWTFWEAIDIANGFSGPEKVVFDSITKTIFVNDGVTELDVGKDIYSAWKRFILTSKQWPLPAAYPEAISAIGGEPLSDILNVGSTFFLENGWRIQPYNSTAGYILTITGNLYTREAGGNPVLFAQGASVNLTRSNLVDQVVAKAALTEVDFQTIATYVWEKSKAGAAVNSYGELANVLDTFDVDRINKGLTKGEFIALG